MTPIHVLPNCKVSEKSNEWFLRYGCGSLGFKWLRRETKNEWLTIGVFLTASTDLFTVGRTGFKGFVGFVNDPVNAGFFFFFSSSLESESELLLPDESESESESE